MIKKVMEDYKVLLRSIPAATVSLFFVSVIMMNRAEPCWPTKSFFACRIWHSIAALW